MTLQSMMDAMSKVLEGIGSLPWAVHALVAAAMVAGLVLWLKGERYVRMVVLIVGAGVGGLLGAFLAPVLGQLGGSALVGTEAVEGSALVYRGLLIGLFIGALAGLLMFRSAMALALGVVMGALVPLAAATILHFWPLSKDAGAPPTSESAWRWSSDDGGNAVSYAAREAGEKNETTARPTGGEGARVDWPDRFREFFAGADSGATATRAGLRAAAPSPRIVLASLVSEQVERSAGDAAERAAELPAVQRIRGFADQVAARAGERWNGLPAAHRSVIYFSGIVGLAAGVILGLMMPAWGAVACTSMFGSAVWISGFVYLSNALGAPWVPALDRGPVTWLGVWAAAAFVGMCVQWTGLLSPKKKKAAGGAPPAAKPAAA
ncbi:MAG TPA: hypothetical protein PL072_06725 [Phycisphaerales bacterium]|nr:hypothetical protein [Phycisphaerales bacterium]